MNESKADIEAFVDKFGQENYDNFLKAKDRLKNNGKSTDIIYYTKNFDVNELEELIKSLYDKKKDAQKLRNLNKEDIRGKYKYYGEYGGYKLYEPLDYLAATDLGKNTGWCTSGRYHHGGHPDFTPNEQEAKKHFNDYTGANVRLFHLMDPTTMYGEYALALYDRVINAEGRDIKIEVDGQPAELLKSNFELYDSMDNNIWGFNKITDIFTEQLGIKLVQTWREI